MDVREHAAHSSSQNVNTHRVLAAEETQLDKIIITLSQGHCLREGVCVKALIHPRLLS